MNNLFNDKILTEKALAEIDMKSEKFKKQREIMNKYINMLDLGTLATTKEEQLQGEFIGDIFSGVLGAVNITDGKETWNLERETTTLMDAQKPDGILGFFKTDEKGEKVLDVRGIIELKGVKINLDTRQKRVGDSRTAVEQAFGYAPKYGAPCQWIIVSNFKEIRLYKSTSMLEYQVFTLENLKDDVEFAKFIYLFSFDSLVGRDGEKAKTQTLAEDYIVAQTEIEKKFYNEYKKIRIEIFENMKQNNPGTSEATIIEKVQKLLDRFLFICFCEDKRLIPENSYANIVKKGNAFGDVFEVFKMFCNWIDGGNTKNNIPHFNGGLFRQDTILDNLYVDDEVFEKMQAIADYDFDSELNENILGHIFEQSISDIEEIKGNNSNNKQSKRKKDGIFYTPKHITKYIVENTIGSWIEDKRIELGEDKLPELTEKDFEKTSRNKDTKKMQAHIDFWEKLRDEVRNIKVVDPACGSGAFLIEAFDYLLKYNEFLDAKLMDLVGTSKLFYDNKPITVNSILENNIYGVDLNKESIEITKLALWLRTADKNKKLTTLENNIKCGNSLRNDLFNWHEEFKNVFDYNNGFDVVIGNPPYVQLQKMKEESKILSEYDYKTFESSGDLYCLFFERGLKLLKNTGVLGFITSNKWMRANYGKALRKYFVENTNPDILVDLGAGIFETATVDSSIFVCHKGISKNKEFNALDLTKVNKFKDFSEYYDDMVKVKYTAGEIWTIENPIEKSIKNKIETIGTPLKDWNIEISRGITTGLNEAFIIDEVTKNKIIEEDINSINLIKPVLRGRDIDAYGNRYMDLYIIIAKLNSYKILKNQYPGIYNHLVQYEDKLKNRGQCKGKEKTPEKPYFGSHHWLELDNRLNDIYLEKMEKEKIIYQETSKTNCFYYDKGEYFISNTASFISGENIKYLLALLNSKLILHAFKNYYAIGLGKTGVRWFTQYMLTLPLPMLDEASQKPFIEKGEEMTKLHKNLSKLIERFKKRLVANLNIEKFSKKLEAFYELDFKDFLKELKKKKIKLKLSEQDEWEEYFEDYKEQIMQIKQHIDFLDKEIDEMVYKLYNLTEEEIEVLKSL